MYRALSFLLAVLLMTPLASSAQDETWIPAGEGYAWSFPQDHWSHPGYKTEWWYFTGHLHDREDLGQRFGYQFTFFRIGLTPEAPTLDSAWAGANLIMGHAAVADLRSGEHVFSELLYRETPFLGGFGRHPDPLLVWSRAPAGTDDRWTLTWNGDGFDFSMHDDAQDLAFALSTTAAKPRVFQGPGGYSRKGDGPTSASLYYSYTRLRTAGTLTLGDATLEVEGESWMDKEFGSNQLEEEQVGWDWFSLQLDDGRELMLYGLRDAEGEFDFALGTAIAADGAVRYLGADDWSAEALETWTSPETGAAYPARWRLSGAALDGPLEVVPLLPDQENRSRIAPDLHYWEGAVEVRDASGRVIGRGFVELTGYGTDSRPAV